MYISSLSVRRAESMAASMAGKASRPERNQRKAVADA
jgi:hypothetical protein